MKKKIIPIIALTSILSFGSLVSCTSAVSNSGQKTDDEGDKPAGDQETGDIKIEVTGNLYAGEIITLTLKNEGGALITKTGATIEITEGKDVAQVSDATKLTIELLKVGTFTVKVTKGEMTGTKSFTVVEAPKEIPDGYIAAINKETATNLAAQRAGTYLKEKVTDTFGEGENAFDLEWQVGNVMFAKSSETTPEFYQTLNGFQTKAEGGVFAVSKKEMKISRIVITYLRDRDSIDRFVTVTVGGVVGTKTVRTPKKTDLKNGEYDTYTVNVTYDFPADTQGQLTFERRDKNALYFNAIYVYGEVTDKEVQTLTVESTKTTLSVGESATLSAKLNDVEENEATFAIVGESDVISLSGNTITALKEGTAKVIATKGELVSRELTITVRDTSVITSIPDFKAAQVSNDVFYNVVGKVVGLSTKDTTSDLVSFYIADAEGNGILIYKLKKTNYIPQVGDYVKATGLRAEYNGVQMKSDTANTATYEQVTDLDFTVTPKTATGTEFKAFTAANSNDYYKVRAAYIGAEGTNYTFRAEDNENILMYVHQNNADDKLNALVVGKTYDITTTAGYHNGSQLIYMDGTIMAEVEGAAQQDILTISISNATINLGETATLSATLNGVEETDVTYSIQDNSAAVTLNGNVVTGAAVGTASIIARKGDVESNVIIVTVVDPSVATNYGTEESPISVADALTILAAECKQSGDWTKQEMYIQGTFVTKSNSSTDNYGYKNVYINDGTSEILIYTINFPTGFTVTNGDVVVIKAFGNLYNSTLELTGNKNKGYAYPAFIRVVSTDPGHGDPTPSITLSADKTTLKVGEEAHLTAELDNFDEGADAEFAITEGSEFAALEGNVLTANAVGTVKVKATCGDVESNVVTITIVEEGGEVETITTIADLKTKSKSTTDFYTVEGKIKSFNSEFTDSATSKVYKSFYIQDDNGEGVYCYQFDSTGLTLEIGTVVKVTGCVDIYNNLFELVGYNRNDATIAQNSKVVVSTTEITGEPVSITGADLEDLGTAQTGATYAFYASIESISGNNFGFKFADGTESVIYASSTFLNEAKANLVVGKTYRVVTPFGMFKTTKQFLYVNGTSLTEIVPEVPVVTLETTATSVQVGSSIELTAKVNGEASTDATIRIVEGSEFARLEGNVLTGVAAGTVKVKATFQGSESDLLAITVKAPVNDLAIFEFGDNGTGGHKEGTGISTYTETNNGYTLTLNNLVNVYGNANDAQGNSCLKVGKSGAAGSFNIDLSNVTGVSKVVFYCACYKSNSNENIAVINGKEYTATKMSDDGEYDEIEITVGELTSISFATKQKRMMINAIAFR